MMHLGKMLLRNGAAPNDVDQLGCGIGKLRGGMLKHRRCRMLRTRVMRLECFRLLKSFGQEVQFVLGRSALKMLRRKGRLGEPFRGDWCRGR